MRNTSSNLSSKEPNLPLVEVLLATYNGEKFLREFLESLERQQGVAIKLRVSDDGSSDSTLEIIREFSNRFDQLIVTKGPKKGPSENFFSLINLADSNFVALADQDDIWEPKHLINSITRLTALDGTPALAFSSVSEFVETKGNQIAIWPSGVVVEGPLIFFFENLARGCTIVFNRSALNYINKYNPKFAIMHDWWIALLISLVGEVIFSSTPEVNYRIHKDNFVGNNPKYFQRLKRFNESRGSEWAPITQLREIYTNYGNEITPFRLKNLDLMVSGLTSPNLSKRIRVILTSHRFRNKVLDDFWLRIMLMTRTNSNTSLSWFLYKRIRALVRRMINLFTQDFPVMFIDFKNIKLLKRHRRFVVNTVSGNLLKSKKIAIVALYPRGPLWNSVARLISSLLEEGYEVVAVVNNSSLRSWIPNLSSFPITIIERENVGRDFGSYKCGVNFLYEKGLITQINSLLLCNDSVIYGSGFGNFLKSFEDQSSDWTTAFLNFEKHTHAQSFFQSFSKEILQGRTFLNFWFDYYPSNRRVHAIDRGEVRLSQQLISEGFFPKSIVNAENIRNNYPSEKLALNDFFSVMPEDFYNTLNLPIQIKNELFWHSLQRSFMEKNCSHLAGLLAFKALGAPLKLDLIATGRVSIESLREALANDGLESGEISELTSEFLATRARLI